MSYSNEERRQIAWYKVVVAKDALDHAKNPAEYLSCFGLLTAAGFEWCWYAFRSIMDVLLVRKTKHEHVGEVLVYQQAYRHEALTSDLTILKRTHPGLDLSLVHSLRDLKP